MQTSIVVKGANCPNCFNETLENLNNLDVVQSVHGSFSGPCIEVEHSEGALDLINKTIREGLHGIELYADEAQMVNLEPVALSISCTHINKKESEQAMTTSTDSKANAIVPTMKLGDIVTQNPSLAIEFEKRGLDYCCQGKRTLSDAADTAGIDPQQLADELTAAMIDEKPAEWASLSPSELVDNIEEVHHKYLWDNFDRTGALVDKVASVHGQNHPELLDVQRLYGEIRSDLEPHLEAEEQVLFPMIRKIASTQARPESEIEELRAQIKVFSHEHEAVGALLEELNRVTSGYATPADGCATYAACYQALADLETDTHLHIHKEGNVLFPAIGL